MAVVIKTITTVAVGNQKPWHVPENLLQVVEDNKFIRLPGSNCPAILRLIFQDKPVKKMSPSQLRGFQLMKERRNEAQKRSFVSASAAAASEFFEAVPGKKKQKMSHPEQQAVRESPQILETRLEDDKDVVVRMLRPAHPSEDVWVQFDEATIKHVIEFVQQCLEIVPEACPRVYTKQASGGEKTWRMGSGRMVVVTKGQKRKYVKHAMVDEPDEVEDEVEPDEVEDACVTSPADESIGAVCEPSMAVVDTTDAPSIFD